MKRVCPIHGTYPQGTQCPGCHPLVPSGDASNTDSITYDPAIDRFTIVDGADTKRGDRWTARHFLHDVGFAFDTADRLLDAAVAATAHTHTWDGTTCATCGQAMRGGSLSD